MPQGDHEPIQHGALRHEPVPESPTQRAARVLAQFQPAEQYHRRRDRHEAEEREMERRIAGGEQQGAECDEHHKSTSRPSSAERYTASSTRCNASWSRGGGAFTSPRITARK